MFSSSFMLITILWRTRKLTKSSSREPLRIVFIFSNLTLDYKPSLEHNFLFPLGTITWDILILEFSKLFLKSLGFHLSIYMNIMCVMLVMFPNRIDFHLNLLIIMPLNHFELIHFDLWGSSLVTSSFNFNYYVTSFDDFSKFTWLYPLKTKNEVFQMFVDFQKKVEKLFSSKILYFQSNWGGEF